MHPLLACSETVVFDLDGTLVLSNIDFSRLRLAAQLIAEEVGYPVETLRGLDSLAVIYRVAEWQPASNREAFLRRAFEQLENIEREYCEGVSARSGARELLKALDQLGIVYGVATRNSTSLARRMLADAQLDIRVVVGREDVPFVKPDPVHLWTVVDQLGMERRNLCVIGDHPMDVRAGRNAGATTIGILPPGDTPERFSSCTPDVIVRELFDLIE